MGAAGVQLGPNVAALTAELHTESGLPLEKTARVLRTRFGLHVTKGGLVRLLHRTADAAAPAYAALAPHVAGPLLPAQYAVAFALVFVDRAGIDVTRRCVWPTAKRSSAGCATRACASGTG